MIRVGKSLVNGDHPNLQWIQGRVEDVQLQTRVVWGKPLG